MPRVCTVCVHGQRAEIDCALVAGEAFRYVAERFGTSATALFRHKAEHLPTAMVQAQAAEEVAGLTASSASWRRCRPTPDGSAARPRRPGICGRHWQASANWSASSS